MDIDVELLPTTNRKKWLELIEGLPEFDIHNHPDYLSIFEKYTGDTGYLLHAQDNGRSFLFPFFIRTGKGFTDALSPWYYGGPVYSGDIDKNFYKTSIEILRNVLEDMGAISLFSRFHPYLNNHSNLTSIEGVERIATVIPVHLERNLEEIMRNSFSGTCRRMLRKGEASGIKVTIHRDADLLPEFHTIYERSMEAKNADDFYFFDLKTLESIFNTFPENSFIVAQEYEGEIIGANINLFMNGRMYYYLGARRRDPLPFNSAYMMMAEAIRFGIENGIKVYDLGGGPEGSGLLQYKQRFSKETIPLYGMKMVTDKEKYIHHCKVSGLIEEKLLFEHAKFFPEYRK